MKNTLTTLALASLLFISCKKEEIAEAPPVDEITTEATTDSLITTTQPTAQQTPPSATGSVMTTQPSANPTTANTAATAKGMNPAHGQPNHRCDIAVGAPLNSPPGKTTMTPATTSPKMTTVTPAMMNTNGTVTPTTQPATPVATAPGMNPPHGQEGHSCSVAVGAPLPKKE